MGTAVSSPEGDGTLVGYNVPSETVIVKVAETGKRCACPKASVCGSRIEYDATYGGDASTPPS